VDKAESEPEKAHAINAEAVSVLADEANRLDAWLVHYSTDYIFDGEKATAYEEDDLPNPLSVYGRTKWQGEQAIRERHAKHLIFRTSWVYTARGSNFVKTILRLAKEREKLSVVADQFGAPTSAELLADMTALALHQISRDERPAALAGTYHLVAQGETTWHAYARYVVKTAKECGVVVKAGPEEILPISTEAYVLPARRPRNSRLSTAKLSRTFGVQLPDWQDHVRRAIEELTSRGTV
jgi:dTDP-4-dehydrorhamnose reductase